MNVIDFILSNWFIVVVLYVLVSTILKRMRNAAGANPRKPGRFPTKGGMPPFGGGGESGWPGGAGNRTPAMTKAAPAKAQAKPQAPPPSPASAAARHEAVPEAARGDSRQARLQPRPEPTAAPGEPSAAIGPLTPQDALRGVVWAEILGPPRAKRPYRYK